MHQITRRQFLKTVAGAGTAVAFSSLSIAAPDSKSQIKLGITLSSYTGDYAATTNLEAWIADAAAIGAKGIEIVSEIHIPNYPDPSNQWIKEWHGLMDKYKTMPSCYVCPMDSRLRKRCGLTLEESLQALVQDIKLAKRLGYTILRPPWKEISPETRAAAPWRQMAQRVLPYAEMYDIRIAPEVHSSTFLNSPAADAYLNLIDKTRTRHLGVLIDIGKGLASTSFSDSSHNENGFSEAIVENPKLLSEILPYTLHFRAPFLTPYLFNPIINSWEIADERQRYVAPFENVIPLLVQAGYEGYISTEYKGPRSAMVASSHLHMQSARLRELAQRV